MKAKSKMTPRKVCGAFSIAVFTVIASMLIDISPRIDTATLEIGTNVLVPILDFHDVAYVENRDINRLVLTLDALQGVDKYYLELTLKLYDIKTFSNASGDIKYDMIIAEYCKSMLDAKTYKNLRRLSSKIDVIYEECVVQVIREP